MGEHVPRTDETGVRVPVPPLEIKIVKDGTAPEDWWFCPVCKQDVWARFAAAHAGFCDKSETVNALP